MPARYRCGFGSYFNRPYFEEHAVGEYWNAAESRWMLFDAQLDDVWLRELKIDFDRLTCRAIASSSRAMPRGWGRSIEVRHSRW